MQITLNRRRVTLATAVVVAGVAAPLAFATMKTAADTAGSPYQVSVAASLNGSQNRCFAVPTPAGVNFVVTQASILMNRPTAGGWIRVKVKLSASPLASVASMLKMPHETDDPGGLLGLELLVKPNSLAAAAVGDVYGIDLCVQTQGPATGALMLTGQTV
jgi:hypothetical protein